MGKEKKEGEEQVGGNENWRRVGRSKEQWRRVGGEAPKEHVHLSAI